jgi:hypothetical protein
MNGGTKGGVSTISLERLHCARRGSAGPTERRRLRNKLHDDELHDLYFSFNVTQVEKDEIGGACDTYGGEKRCILSFGGET